MNVFVLATVRNPELLPYATLVFRTIRIGFPTANISVFGNALGRDDYQQVRDACEQARCEFYDHAPITHAQWIEELIISADQPFWICDTDLVFYQNVEAWTFDTALAGYRVPEFFDEFTGCITRSRLHTSLLYIDPIKLRGLRANYVFSYRTTQFNPPIDLIKPISLPFNGRTYFYDCCSLLYHAIGGTPFTAQQKDSYSHLHFGTFSDLVLPRLNNGMDIGKARQAVLDNPELGRGMWRAQDEYFQAKQFVQDGVDVIAPVDPKDGEAAVKWNIELCRGNRDAMATCDMFYRFAHACDDLLDSMVDGRPRMSKEQILETFINLGLLYHSPFYVQNRDILFPIIIQLTNTYADSVAWEHSPKAHLRKMGDCFRTCGNEFFIMIGLICGGWSHMRRMSPAIKENDYVRQHDAHDNPI